MRRALLTLFMLASLSSGVSAQATQKPPDPLNTQMLAVDGGAMRVWIDGIAQRKPNQPVIVLEAGAGNGLETWRPIFRDVAALGPVVAYDRRGLGQSEADTQKPTLSRVGQSLHALLQTAKISPPYVLVGQSWGGVFIRSFAHQYPTEVAGLVYVEVTDFEATREKKFAVLSPIDAKAASEPPTIPDIPADTPPGLRGEYEQIRDNLTGDFAEARSFRQPAGIPVAVVLSGRKGGTPVADALLKLQISNQSDWAFSSSNGLLIVSDTTGHMVHRDDPALVLQAIRHVLQPVPAQKK
jgi:pimeloyl-ACP methyl ester carboxylesterase